MSVAQTSIAAFYKIKPELGARQQEVFDELVGLGRASNQTLAYCLKLQINQVTPRVNELVKLGKIEVDGVEMGDFGHVVKVWRPVQNKPEQIDMFIEQDCAV